MGAVANASPLLLLQGYSQCLLQLGSLHLEKYVFLSLKWKKNKRKDGSYQVLSFFSSSSSDTLLDQVRGEKQNIQTNKK